MTFATFRAAAEHVARAGTMTPHQLAAWEAAWERATTEQRQAFTEGWRAQGSPAAPAPAPVGAGELANLQSWLTFLTGPEVSRLSRNKISPLTVAEACGFIGCIIVETGRPMLDKLDVVEAGSGAGRGAMQYTGVRRTAYDKARSAAVAKGLDPNSNSWQQQYFAEEYAGLHDPSQGSLIGWTRVFEDRPLNMTPAQAAEYWTGSAATRTGYFRPGVPHLDRRQAEAQRVWGLAQSGRLLATQQRPPLQQQSAPAPTPAERRQWVTQIKALNLSQPDASTCQAACIGMAVGDRDVAGIRRRLVARGSAGSTTVMASVIREYGRPYALDQNASLAKCREWLKAGEFLITHGHFTGSGHVICLDGLQLVSSAYRLDVKDPWSEFNAASWRYDLGGKFFDGFYSELLIYATCVASTSVGAAQSIYRQGRVDANRGGMWVHRFLTS
jgi:hypothetical protein